MGHYAVWRYFTGSRDDSLHLPGARRCSTAVVHARHTSFPASGNQGTHGPHGPGGACFIEFATSGSQDLTITFTGDTGYRWRAYVLGIRNRRAWEHRINLVNDSGTIVIPAWEATTAVLIPVVTRWRDSADYMTPAANFSYSASANDAGIALDEGQPDGGGRQSIGPNPARGALRIPHSAFRDPRSPVILLDAAGHKVMNLQLGANDVRRLAPGVYFVREESPIGNHARKVVLTR
jgi:hypothetical protein